MSNETDKSEVEMIDCYGVLPDGTKGPDFKMPMPPHMKFKEILGSYLGRDFDEEDCRPEFFALCAWEEWWKWYEKQQAAIATIRTTVE